MERSLFETRDGPAREEYVGFHCQAPIDDSSAALEATRLAVTRAKSGDGDAFRFLYARYSHNIYGYVRSIMGDDHEAEDVTQDVFAKLMITIAKYDDRGVPFFGWLARMARNTAVDRLRATRTTPFEQVYDPEMTLDVIPDISLVVRDAFAALPEDQRDVVLLRHIAGLSPPEIADRMGRTESSIHGLHNRGRRALCVQLRRLELEPSTRATQRRPRSVEPRQAAA
jgi:RNA polymerase sigma-70 factor, ECF subfamily